MKNKLLLFSALLFIATGSSATIHTVSAGGTDGYSFIPASLTMHPGDTIIWAWGNGSHTTTSTNIPPGAASWNSNINTTTTSFMYVATVPGTYNYQCSFQVAMGMTGSFTVTSPSGIPTVSKTSNFTAYPNPASESLHIIFQNSSRSVLISLTDMNGKEVLRQKSGPISETELDLTDIPDGTYILHVEQHHKISTEEILVHH